VDDYSSYCWSYILKRNDELAAEWIGLIKELKNDKIRVMFLRLDDAGENYALDSGPCTPQRNDKVERKFQTLFGRIRAMMNDSGIEGEFREGLWAQRASTAKYYGVIIINKNKKRFLIELMFKENSKVWEDSRDLEKMRGNNKSKDSIQTQW
jgi:hypothetical protein